MPLFASFRPSVRCGDSHATNHRCRYYLKGSRGVTQWEFALHADGPNGALICRVSSGYIGPPINGIPGPMQVNIISRRRPISIERRRGTPEGTHWFRGPDDGEYHWRSSTHLWRNEMQVRSGCFEMDICGNRHGLPTHSSSVWTQKEISWLVTAQPRWLYPRMASCAFIRYGIACFFSLFSAVRSPIGVVVRSIHDRPPGRYEPCDTDTEPLEWNSMKVK